MFNANIIIEVGVQNRVRVVPQSPDAPTYSDVRVRGMQARVIASGDMTDIEWDAEKVAQTEQRLTQKLDSMMKTRLKRMDPSSMTAQSFNRMTEQVVAVIRGEAESEIAAIFPDVVAQIQIVNSQATAVVQAVSLAVRPDPVSSTPPVVVDPVDPEPEYPAEGLTLLNYGSAIDSAFRLPNGSLFSGTGIPGDFYNIARNDLLELAIMSHRRTQWAQNRIADGEQIVLDLVSLTDRWNITWSVGALQSDLSGLLEFYDISLILGLNSDGSLNAGQYLEFILEAGEGTHMPYVLRESTGNVHPTIDSKGDPSGRSIQNSTSHHWFKPVLIPAIADADPVEGTYTVLLRAVHKHTGNIIEARTVTTANFAGNDAE